MRRMTPRPYQEALACVLVGCWLFSLRNKPWYYIASVMLGLGLLIFFCFTQILKPTTIQDFIKQKLLDWLTVTPIKLADLNVTAHAQPFRMCNGTCDKTDSLKVELEQIRHAMLASCCRMKAQIDNQHKTIRDIQTQLDEKNSMILLLNHRQRENKSCQTADVKPHGITEPAGMEPIGKIDSLLNDKMMTLYTELRETKQVVKNLQRRCRKNGLKY